MEFSFEYGQINAIYDFLEAMQVSWNNVQTNCNFDLITPFVNVLCELGNNDQICLDWLQIYLITLLVNFNDHIWLL